jgi:hypothetical protein
MKNRISLVLVTGLLSIGLVPAATARADAAPPYSPQGSNIGSSGDTKVQMLDENVLLEIVPDASGRYYERATAEFLMRNQGTEAEMMDVRFPMERIDGMGDGYGGNPKLRNFAVRVDGTWLAAREIQEPFEEGAPPVSWSTFPVTFPVGKDVFIQVYYDADIRQGTTGEKWIADYTLTTGAGWYGPIRNGVVSLRYPFAVGELNASGQLYGQDCISIGRELRCHFANLEPEYNVSFSFIYPAYWQEILDLELATGEMPEDVSLALELADAYARLALEKHGRPVFQGPIIAAEMIVEQALMRNPEEVTLHIKMVELLEMEHEGLIMEQENLMTEPFENAELLELQDRIDDKEFQKCSEANLIMQLDPVNGYGSYISAQCELASGEKRDATPEASSESSIQSQKSTVTPISASSTPTSPPTERLTPTTDMPGGVNGPAEGEARAGVEGWQAGLLAVGTGLTGFLIGILIRRRK